MKQVRKILTLAVLILSGSEFATAIPNSITINSKILLSEDERQVSGFSEIIVSGRHNVYVTMGSTESLRLEGDADAINEIETKVDNGVLKIRNKKHEKYIGVHYGCDGVSSGKGLELHKHYDGGLCGRQQQWIQKELLQNLDSFDSIGIDIITVGTDGTVAEIDHREIHGHAEANSPGVGAVFVSRTAIQVLAKGRNFDHIDESCTNPPGSSEFVAVFSLLSLTLVPKNHRLRRKLHRMVSNEYTPSITKMPEGEVLSERRCICILECFLSDPLTQSVCVLSMSRM